jgi:hypothetical protein
MDTNHAIDLVNLAQARIFLAKLKVSTAKPDPPIGVGETPTKIHRTKGGGCWAYLSKNAKNRQKSKYRDRN